MTQEEMEAQYSTGDRICVHYTNKWRRWPSEYHKPSFNEDANKYKLIHKKHSDVLDHVLRGGSVNKMFKPDVMRGLVAIYNADFINHYDANAYYEIIKDKPDLNGHYCLATKLHYEKLVEDGCVPKGLISMVGMQAALLVETNVLLVVGNEVHIEVLGLAENSVFNPMHLHNNEWVFGSLERDKSEHEMIERLQPDYLDELRPVERTTREEFKKRLYPYGKDEYVFGYIPSDINKLFDYIEYLEATQKENS